MSTRTRQDWILWAQLGCALVATAHAEYTLVTALGQHWVVAGAVTGALDLYVVRALQKHKDVLPAVLVMVAANVVSILISARVVPVHWAVLGAVGALAPLLVWRGHRLRVHEMRQVQAAGIPSGAVSAPEVPVPDLTCPWAHDECKGDVRCTVYSAGPEDGYAVHSGAPDHVPAEWSTPGTDSPVPYLTAVPDLPEELGWDARSLVHPSPVLTADDWVHLEHAAGYVRECREENRTPTVRGLKAAISVGQERAKRLLQHLEGGPK